MCIRDRFSTELTLDFFGFDSHPIKPINKNISTDALAILIYNFITVIAANLRLTSIFVGLFWTKFYMRSSLFFTLIPSFLSFVLLLPYGGALIHILEGQEHKPCDISAVHFHQVAIDCDIFDYNFVPKIEFSNHVSYFNSPRLNKSKNSISSSLHFILSINPYLLRGPPST